MRIRQLFKLVPLAVVVLSAPSSAEVLSSGWNVDPDHGVIYFVDGVHIIAIADGPAFGGSPPGQYGSFSQVRNLAVGQYSLSYNSTGVPGAPAANTENLVPSIGGAGSGANLVFTQKGSFVSIITAPFMNYSDIYTVTQSGPAAITFTFSSSGCTQYCGIGFDYTNVELTLLSLSAIAGQLPASTPSNALNVAKAIDPFTANLGTFPSGFISLYALSSANIVNGLMQAAGEAGTGIQQAGFDAAGQFISSVFENAFNSASIPIGDEPFSYAAKPKVSRQAQQAYAAVTPRDRALSFESRWSVWGSAYGGSGTISGDNATGSNKTTSSVYGAVAGANYRVYPSTQVGFALGGAGSNFGIANGFGGGKAGMFNAAVYARHEMGPAYLAGALGYTWQDASTDRTVTINGVDVLHASFHPQALIARLEAGRRYAMHAFAVSPYGAVQSATIFLPSYGETATSGASTFALNYAGKTVTAERTEFGARWEKAIVTKAGVVTLKAKTAWAHDWNTDRSVTATFQSLPAATFTVNGAQPSADVALLSLGGEITLRKNWTIASNFDSEFGAIRKSYAGKGVIKYAW